MRRSILVLLSLVALLAGSATSVAAAHRPGPPDLEIDLKDIVPCELQIAVIEQLCIGGPPPVEAI